MVDKTRLKQAIKTNDGWWASIFSGPVANFFLKFVVDIKWISPNCVTTSSLLLCILACGFIANGASVFLVVAAFLIQLVFILDCMDGQLARYRNEHSNFGAWYDRVTDRIKDFVIYFSIAFGHYDIYKDWIIWPLAMASLFFVYLFDYYVNQDVKLVSSGQWSVVSSKKSRLSPLSSQLLDFVFSLGEKVYKSFPILQFHIGEQYLLISLFLFFNQTRLLLYLIVLLGFFYSFYWPLSQYFGRKPSTIIK